MGSPIREARESAGLSQQDLAQRIGVTVATVHNWECGHSIPHKVIREKLDRVLQGLKKEEKVKIPGETKTTEEQCQTN